MPRSEFSGPPTGGNLPRISDQSRRRSEDTGPRSRAGTGTGTSSGAGTAGNGAGTSTGRAAAAHGGNGHGRPRPGDAVDASSSGKRGLLIGGATVAVIVLILVVYFMTQPSGSSNTSGATADATISQTAMNPPAPSSLAAAPVNSASASAAASGSAMPSSSASAGSPTASSSVAVNLAEVHVAVFNGSGVNQRAAAIKTQLVNRGFTLATVGGTDPKTATTKVYYPAARADSAAAVANALAIPSADLSESTTYTEVTVVIGTDWSSGNTYPAQ